MIVLVAVQHISAKMNPAFCFGLWLLGELDAGDCFALSGAQVGGAMIGASLVWLFYLPHFKTIPEPTPLSPRDALLRSRDAESMSALR